jgi:long-chain acyl-CoA synthetase
MRRVELLVSLEQSLGGDVKESLLSDIYTVRELVDAVRESAASGATAGREKSAFAGWNAVLREDPTDPDALAISKPRPVLDPIVFTISRFINWFWRLRSRIQIDGMENLPDGAYLLCSNHQSFLDPVILMSSLSYRSLSHMFAVGTSEIFGGGFMRKIARLLKVVVVDPDANLVPAMRAGAYGLRHGMALILYPEGERSIDGTPKTFKKGAAILSIHLQVPIVPVAIEGFYEAWPRNQKFQKFVPLKVKIGQPLQPPAESQASEEVYAKLTADLKARVVAMWEEMRDSKAETVSVGN